MDLIRFPDNSRVWVYTSSREFQDDELGMLEKEIQSFTREWTSHNKELHATGGILHNRFLVLVVDESKSGASGCSIDSSVRFIRHLEQRFQTDFFNRQLFCYLKGEEVNTVQQSELKSTFESGQIGENTLFFDPLVQTKGAFLENWLKPLGSSWFARMLR